MILLKNATIVTSEKEAVGSILIEEGKIKEILYVGDNDYE